jgi:hypothetical protein
MGYSLQQRVDAFVSGECRLDTFVHELFELFDAQPDSAWDALSLIDQYYRRGKLSAELFRTVRHRIERRALDVPDSDLARGRPDARAGGGASVGAMRANATERQERSASETRTPPIQPIEPPNVARLSQRLGKRPAKQAHRGHRARRSLANTRGGLLETSAKVAGTNVARDRMRTWRPLRTFVAVLLAAVLLGFGASRSISEFPSQKDARETAPTAASPVIPQRPDPGQIGLSADTYVVSPGAASADIEIHRTRGVQGDVSFEWWTQRSRGTAPGRDFASRLPTRAYLPDGVDTLHLSVPIIANPSRKHTELFYIVIGKPGGGASLGSTKRATVFIMAGR